MGSRPNNQCGPLSGARSAADGVALLPLPDIYFENTETVPSGGSAKGNTSEAQFRPGQAFVTLDQMFKLYMAL